MESAAVICPQVVHHGYSSCPSPSHHHRRNLITTKHSTSISFSRNRANNNNNKLTSSRTYAAVAEVSGLTSPQVEITWQIVVGALAGVTPFVVAGIEFSKRIMQQRLCGECKGSGLIMREDKTAYVRCPSCGGFLPWQSWRRFFTG